MYEDRQYSETEIAQIVAHGISPQAVSGWPMVMLPSALATVARAALMEDPEDPHAIEGLEEALRPRRGFRTPWGCIVVDYCEPLPGDGDELFLTFNGYLEEDPHLELPHLRTGSAVVGAYLSDVTNPVLEVSAENYLGPELQWAENGETNQLFGLLTFVHPSDEQAFVEHGAAVGRWLAAARIPEAMRLCAQPEMLAEINDDMGIFITRSVVN